MDIDADTADAKGAAAVPSEDEASPDAYNQTQILRNVSSELIAFEQQQAERHVIENMEQDDLRVRKRYALCYHERAFE